MAAGIERIRVIILANLRASPGKSAFLGVAFVVLLVLLIRQFAGGPKAATAVNNLADAWNALTVETSAVTPIAQTVERQPRPQLATAVARDLFACEWLKRSQREDDSESGSESRFQDGLVLQCTMRDAGTGSRLAVISGVVLYTGSVVEGYEVKSIGLRHVVLQSPTEERVLRLP